MTQIVPLPSLPPDAAVREVIDRHGAFRVLRLALAALIVPRARRLPPVPLDNDHLRCDIGLPPISDGGGFPSASDWARHVGR